MEFSFASTNLNIGENEGSLRCIVLGKGSLQREVSLMVVAIQDSNSLTLDGKDISILV